MKGFARKPSCLTADKQFRKTICLALIFDLILGGCQKLSGSRVSQVTTSPSVSASLVCDWYVETSYGRMNVCATRNVFPCLIWSRFCFGQCRMRNHSSKHNDYDSLFMQIAISLTTLNSWTTFLFSSQLLCRSQHIGFYEVSSKVRSGSKNMASSLNLQGRARSSLYWCRAQLCTAAMQFMLPT